MRSLTATGLRIERLAKQQDGQSVGATIAAILSAKGSRAPVPDAELARTATGRLLLERRVRTEAGCPGSG
jgi:hypothetical protein